MKTSFLLLFAYLAAAVVLEVIGHVSHALLIACIDTMYLVAIITNRSALTLFQSIIILIFFAAWNDNRSYHAADVIADVLFLVIGITNSFLIATGKKINIFSKDRKITDL